MARQELLRVRLDADELAALDRLATRRETTRSDIVRSLVLGAAMAELEPEPVETGDFERHVEAWLAYAERIGTTLRAEVSE